MPREQKKKIDLAFSGACDGFMCDWAVTKSGFSCVTGEGGCEIAILVDAEESYFHPPELIEATKKINRILSKIPKDPKGRKLSFCHTRMGLFLALCSHTGKAKAKRAVTRHDSDEKVARALKLKVKK